MAKQLTVGGTTYNYPSPGEDPNWGEPATAWAEAVTDVLGSVFNENDILETTFNLANNVSSAANILGLTFNPASVRAAYIDYTIYRVSDSNPSDIVEVGEMSIIYDNSASVGEKWKLTREANGNAGVDIDVEDTGQFTYTSSDIGAAGYSGTMKFKARTIFQ